MTLVIGKILGDRGFLIADTLTTSSFDSRVTSFSSDWTRHVLKLHLLSPYVAVGFSGDVQGALRIISHLYKSINSKEIPNPSAEIFRIYGSTDFMTHDCEFIVLHLKQAFGPMTLSKVTSTQIISCEEAHIGDEFERYNQFSSNRTWYESPKSMFKQLPDGSFIETELTNQEGTEAFMSTTNSLQEYALNRRGVSVGAIGGNIVRLANSSISGVLEYMQSVEVSTSTEEGESGYTHLASNNGRHGLGIYFRSGKLGFVFVAGEETGCIRLQADSLLEFISKAKEHYDLNLTGGTWQLFGSRARKRIGWKESKKPSSFESDLLKFWQRGLDLYQKLLVFAIVGDKLWGADMEDELHVVSKILFGIGEDYHSVKIGSGKLEGGFLSELLINKTKGKPVVSDAFYHDSFKGISEVLHADRSWDVLNSDGDEICFTSNPPGTNMLPQGFFQFGREFWTDSEKFMSDEGAQILAFKHREKK